LCKNDGLSVLSSIGDREKSRVGGNDSHVVFGKKIPDERLSMRLHCPDASEVFAHFHAAVLKVTVVCRIDCLACQEEVFVRAIAFM
jgi:hypothetical protein